jgi:hypothetical protein
MCYNIKSIAMKSPDELKELNANGLGIASSKLHLYEIAKA